MMYHPAIVLLVVAVILATLNRFVAWSRAALAGTMPPEILRRTITVVIILPPDASLDFVTDLIRNAKWKARVKVKVFKMLNSHEDFNEYLLERHRNLYVESRFGDFDMAGERSAFLQRIHSTLDTEFVLCFRDRVECEVGWDETLIAMWDSIDDPMAILTAPLSAVYSRESMPQFLSIDAGGTELQHRDFYVVPVRPQPSLFLHGDFFFAPIACIHAVPSPKQISRTNEHLLLAKAFWMQGFNFYAPTHVLFFYLQRDEQHVTTKETKTTWKPPSDTNRTLREWMTFSGQRAQGWTRRARLGLTPRAEAEEQYSKFGDALKQHGYHTLSMP